MFENIQISCVLNVENAPLCVRSEEGDFFIKSFVSFTDLQRPQHVQNISSISPTAIDEQLKTSGRLFNVVSNPDIYSIFFYLHRAAADEVSVSFLF
jgi:hypothetical protein